MNTAVSIITAKFLGLDPYIITKILFLAKHQHQPEKSINVKSSKILKQNVNTKIISELNYKKIMAQKLLSKICFLNS